MKGLTLHQPWASLVAIGEKDIETRSWATSYRGELAIHAGKSFPYDQKMLCLDPAFSPRLEAAGCIVREPQRPNVRRLALPRGAIVAVAELRRCLSVERIWFSLKGVTTWPTHPDDWLATPREQLYGDFSPGRFGWLLANVRRLPEPIPCRGAQGLWDVPAEVAAEIRRQIGNCEIGGCYKQLPPCRDEFCPHWLDNNRREGKVGVPGDCFRAET